MLCFVNHAAMVCTNAVCIPIRLLPVAIIVFSNAVCIS